MIKSMYITSFLDCRVKDLANGGWYESLSLILGLPGGKISILTKN